jgi:hypothetical protein
MEQERARVYFRKILLILSTVVGVFLVTGWVVWYAPFLANNEQVLLLRNRYFYRLSQVLPPDKLLYSIRPIAVTSEGGERIYTYKLAGRVGR